MAMVGLAAPVGLAVGVGPVAPVEAAAVVAVAVAAVAVGKGVNCTQNVCPFMKLDDLYYFRDHKSNGFL